MKKTPTYLFLSLLAAFLSLLLIGCGSSSGSKSSSNVSTLEPSSADFPNADLLVSAYSVQKSLNSKGLVVIDARSSGYESAHIPKAINLKFGDFFTPGTGLLPVANLEAKLGQAGLKRDMTFVIYDDTTASFGAAGRIFWMLEYLGCNDVHMLDGGWDKWIADNRATETKINSLPAATFVAQIQDNIRSTKSYIRSNLQADNFTIVDARADEEYIGWQRYGEARGGHIPGAVQIPYEWYFKGDKTVQGYLDLKTMFESRGVTQDKEVTAYCTVGIRSGFVYFLLRLMGYPHASNYDASIVEWAADSSLPMEKAPRFSEIVYPAWVKALIEYHKPDSTSAAPPEYHYDRDHKYLIFETQWGSFDDMAAGWADNSYLVGHIPGAIHSNSDVYENGAPRWFLIPDDELKAAIGSMGITEDTTVVVYSDSRIFAARLWWILKYAGVHDVRFMNGGSQQWIANGYDTETTINYPVPATFNGTTHPEYLATTDYVFSTYTNTGTTLIADVRSKDEYDGLISGYSYVVAKGRIPNSVWASDGDDGSPVYNDNDGTLRSYTEVRDFWKGIGISSTGASNLFDKEVIFQCGSGYRSALTFLYAYMMGYDNIRNYSDGWEGWSTTYTKDSECNDGAEDWCQNPSGRPIIIQTP